MTAAVLESGGRARARTAPDVAGPRAGSVRAVVQCSDFPVIAQHMFGLMMRNVAADGFRFEDPVQRGRYSTPGCVIAAPSYPANSPGVDQDYVFNWTRDAAITAMEVAASSMRIRGAPDVEPLEDYVRFAAICQGNAIPTLAHACFTVEGNSRPWSEQNDGPALQTVAILQAFALLDEPTRDLARQVIGRNLDFLLEVYRQPTTNLWEEHVGYSFFARAVQLRCFREIAANTIGVTVPAGCQEAADWLEGALASHWDGARYLSLIGEDQPPAAPAGPGYDPNIAVVMAAIYGAVPVGDPRLLATAAELRRQWSDPASSSVYPVNLADQQLGIGPMVGRYPGDTYDGDVANPVQGGHPWPLTTGNFSELYYRLAGEVRRTGSVPHEELSASFFAQVGVAIDTPPQEAAAALEQAGDRMLQAVVYHSDNLELSEQFDGTTGFCRSVSNLTWSYAAFLSAVRAKADLP